MAGAIRTEGLPQLIRAFNKMDRDLVGDLIWELQESADPVRSLTEEKILGELENMPPTPFFAQMRIGVSKGQGLVYVAPEWRRGSGAGTPRPSLAHSIRKRMDQALEDKSNDIEKRLGDFLDRLADDWGRGG